MNVSVADRVYTTSTIIFSNDINCNHMKQRKSLRTHSNNTNNIIFGANKSNRLKKLSTINYQYPTNDTNQTGLASIRLRRRHHIQAINSISFIINWHNNIHCRLNSRSRHLLPTPPLPPPSPTTHFGRERNLTNLNVHFECDSRYFFHISSKIYSR